MDIELNGQMATLNAPPEGTLKEAIAKLRKHLAVFGQVVSEMELDGTPLTAAREEEFGDRPVGGFALLKATSVPARAVVRSVLAGLRNAIDPMQDAGRAIGDLVQQDRRAEALHRLKAYTSDLGAFVEGLHHSYILLGVRTADIQKVVDQGLKELQELLVRLNACLRTCEDVAFSDLVSFEIPDCLEKWRGSLDRTSELLAAAEHDAPKEDPSRN